MNQSPAARKLHIHAISDKELLSIFGRLPLHDLIRLESVCRRWASIQALACRAKHSLTIYDSQLATNREIMIDMYSLMYLNEDATGFELSSRENPNFVYTALMPDWDSLNRADCEKLVKRFPNLTCLNIIGISLEMNAFVLLLQRYPNLEQLIFQVTECVDRDWNNIWKFLDSMHSLKRLAMPRDLELNKLYSSECFKRLESLHIPVGCDTNCREMKALFKGIASSAPQLRRLCVTDLAKDCDSDYDDGTPFFDLNEKFVQILSATPHVFTQITHFGWQFGEDGDGVDCQLLSFICAKFTSLTHLDLNPSGNLKFEKMLPLLAKLTNLTSVRIAAVPEECDYDVYDYQKDMIYPESDVDQTEPDFDVKDDDDPTDDYESDDYDSENNQLFLGLTSKNYRTKLVQLENIRSLNLAFLNINRWIVFDYLQYAFPNIEQLNFEQCILSLGKIPERSSTSKRLLLLEKFKSFASLRTISRNYVQVLSMDKIRNDPQAETIVLEREMKLLFEKYPWNQEHRY